MKHTSGHIHLDARIGSQLGGMSLVACHAMGNKLIDSRIIRHYKTVEPPLITKHILIKEFTGSARHTGNLIEGSHESSHTRIFGSLERREINIAQRALRHISRIIITTSFSSTICTEVFGASQHLVQPHQVFGLLTLETAYTCGREQ